MNKNVMTPTDNTTLHPAWCSPEHCGIEVGEAHRSAVRHFQLWAGKASAWLEAPDGTFHATPDGLAAWHHRVVLHLPSDRLRLNPGEVAALTRLVTRLDVVGDEMGAPVDREVTR